MKKAFKVVGVILMLIALLALKTVWQSGAFKTITNSFSGTTQSIEGFAGVEDITIDQSTGLAFLSSDDRWAGHLRKQPVKGAIFRLNLNDSVQQPVNLTLNFGQEDFHPHGISLFRTLDGKRILFVVNHRQSGNSIEIFEYRNDSLIHQQSVSDELMISPNDVVGVGERQFYFTNDHNEKPSTWRMMKEFLTIGSGNVCYYDGKKMLMTSVTDVKYANGVNVSANGKKLYVAATIGRSIMEYDRDTVSGALSNLKEVFTGTGVDNIEIDREGNLWVGCHPQLLKFLSHAKDEAVLSPSEVIRLVKKDNGEYDQATIYINDGSEISASSVGAVYKNTLLIGPVFQRHFLLVNLK